MIQERIRREESACHDRQITRPDRQPSLGLIRPKASARSGNESPPAGIDTTKVSPSLRVIHNALALCQKQSGQS